ncbi:glutamate--cysteine ligase [bacterium]|nr:glutamate--cysteine ligase [bacterium]
MSAAKFKSPLKSQLADLIQANRKKLWDWHMSHAEKVSAPFYCSVDLRDSGFKIAPVDSNLFPGGFNNICHEDVKTSMPIFRAHIEAEMSQLNLQRPTRILVVPESHTNNKYYIENLYYLTNILKGAGFEVALGWYGSLSEGVSQEIELVAESGNKLKAYPMVVKNKRAQIEIAGKTFDPEMLILNNDFSGGYPKMLDGLEQPVFPSHSLGWHSRKKSRHFYHYNRLAGEFASIVGMDPWAIQVETDEVTPVNFNEEIGIDQVTEKVGNILEHTRKEYAQRKIEQPPFVFVKNNSGTYGMGIMMVHSADELKKMNRRTKNKMSVGKNRQDIGSVAIQEGIPTSTIVDKHAAEPVIYLVGCELIGGFLRTNTAKGVEENLNSEGMVFRKLCMSDLRDPVQEERPTAGDCVLELVYGSIARLSALATGYELLEAKTPR